MTYTKIESLHESDSITAYRDVDTDQYVLGFRNDADMSVVSDLLTMIASYGYENVIDGIEDLDHDMTVLVVTQ